MSIQEAADQLGVCKRRAQTLLEEFRIEYFTTPDGRRHPLRSSVEEYEPMRRRNRSPVYPKREPA